MSELQFQQIRLHDGRTLAYAEYGARHGLPIMRCHGTPSSRLEGAVCAAAAVELGVRIIVPDRPGIGRSDFQPERRIEHWPKDILELANALSLDEFAILGASGGAPYALACASQIRGRVRAVGLVNGVAPLDAPGALAAMQGPSRTLYQLARRAPWVLRGLLPLMGRAARAGSHTSERMAASFPEADRRIFQQPQLRAHFGAVFMEALRQGPRGVIWDMRLIASPWGFEPAAVAVPVLLWQAEQDRNVPAAHGRHLAAAIPSCRATFYPHEAHLSLFVNRHREILADLAAAAGSS